MTNIHELTQTWHAMQGVAPDLLIPITDEESLTRATAAVQKLSEEIQASTDGPHPLDDLVRLVIQRITSYEAEHYPIPDVDGADMLEFLIDQFGISQSELARATGIPQSTISNLIKRKREFTAAHARAFAKYFGGDAGLFL